MAAIFFSESQMGVMFLELLQPIGPKHTRMGHMSTAIFLGNIIFLQEMQSVATCHCNFVVNRCDS